MTRIDCFGVFVDVEKEAYGKCDRTLFVFDWNQEYHSVVGKNAPKKDEEIVESFHLFEIVDLLEPWRIERVYIGARETNIHPQIISYFKKLNVRLTFETSDLLHAQWAQDRFGDVVDVVYRVCGDFSVKVRQGNKLIFLKAMELWEENTQIDGHIIRGADQDERVRLLKKLEPPNI